MNDASRDSNPPSLPVTPTDLGYPRGLQRLRPPPIVYVGGRLPSAPGVAVVGARLASRQGLSFARALAVALCEHGWSVWSGGAKGIDTAAHQGALAAGGDTVLVHAGGLRKPAPTENAPLFDAIEKRGAVLAQMPDNRAAQLPDYLYRNRILAACTELVVVVEAAMRSGARSTAAAARRVETPLCVVPQAPWGRFSGCARELARGAHAVGSVGDVLKLLRSPACRTRRPDMEESGSMSALERTLLRLIEREAVHIDQLLTNVQSPKTPVSYPAVAAALFELVLGGHAVEVAPQTYRRR